MKVKYIDLGLPSGTLWSECSTDRFPEPLGITPSWSNVNEIYHNCKLTPKFIIGPNGNKIFNSYLRYHLIKYGSDR